MEQNALIEILGLLSPYGPLMPAHPMSRPGYTVEGWERMGDLGAENTEDYDTRDGIIYGDRVIRLATTRNGKFFAGLYDPYYGISNVAIPLYVDQAIVKSRKTGLKELWKQPMIGGTIAKLKGRVKQIPSFYSQFVEQVPSQYRMLPSYGLEVFEVKELNEARGVTHMAVSVGWEKRNEERLRTHYFNVQDKKQFEIAEALLDDGRKSHSKSLLFNYDDLACYSPKWRHRIPKYNDMLKPWLEGENLH